MACLIERCRDEGSCPSDPAPELSPDALSAFEKAGFFSASFNGVKTSSISRVPSAWEASNKVHLVSPLQVSIPSTAAASAVLHLPTAALQAFFAFRAALLSPLTSQACMLATSDSLIASTQVQLSSMLLLAAKHFENSDLKLLARVSQASSSASLVAFPVVGFPHLSPISVSQATKVVRVSWENVRPLVEFDEVELKGWPPQVGLDALPPSADRSRSFVELKSDFLFPFEPWILSLPLILFTCLLSAEAFFSFSLE